MKICGHGMQAHLRLLAPAFALIAAVWALRIVLHAAGVPARPLRVCSVTAAGPVAVLLAVVLMHLRRFGGYANVVFAVFLLECWKQTLVVLAIVFTVVTGMSNAYSVPAYSYGMSYRQHIFSHLTLGLGFGTIFGALTGCLFFALLRLLVPVTPPKENLKSS